jgi:transglutaminase-like putative cysteine protease
MCSESTAKFKAGLPRAHLRYGTLRLMSRLRGGCWSSNAFLGRSINAILLSPRTRTTTMHIRYGYEIELVCDQQTPLVTMLDVHPSRRSDVTQPDDMLVTGLLTNEIIESTDIYLDQFGNICRRILAPAEGVLLAGNGVLHDSGFADPQQPGADVLPPEKLPSETLTFLLGSRYCDTDMLATKAWARFGDIAGGWHKVQAICDHVNTLIRFSYGQAPNLRTATEAIEEGTGVCRDFAHIAITFCRCLNIPAKYCTGYLGDIGVPADGHPMDFSAWFEVYLDDSWWTFDARNNTPRIGRILIARGRDATDVPFINSFGAHQLKRFDIVTEEVSGSRYPITSQDRRDHWGGEAEQMA